MKFGNFGQEWAFRSHEISVEWMHPVETVVFIHHHILDSLLGHKTNCTYNVLVNMKTFSHLKFVDLYLENDTCISKMVDLTLEHQTRLLPWRHGWLNIRNAHCIIVAIGYYSGKVIPV